MQGCGLLEPRQRLIERGDVGGQMVRGGLHVLSTLPRNRSNMGRIQLVNGGAREPQSVTLLKHGEGLMQHGTSPQFGGRQLAPNVSLYLARELAERRPIAVARGTCGSLLRAGFVPVSEMAVVNRTLSHPVEVKLDETDAPDVVPKVRLGYLCYLDALNDRRRHDRGRPKLQVYCPVSSELIGFRHLRYGIESTEIAVGARPQLVDDNIRLQIKELEQLPRIVA